MNRPTTNRGYEIIRSGSDAFAYDIKSGRLFALQEVLAELLESDLDDPRDLQRVIDAHGEHAVRRARLELSRVRDMELLLPAPVSDEHLGILKKSSYCQATVVLTDRCNLRCKYCFDGYRNLRDAGGGVSMDWLSVHRTLDYVFRAVGAGCEIFDIHFFGGEPLLEFDVLRQATDYCREIAQTHHVTANLSISTNGLLLTPEIVEFLRANEYDVSISLDGPPQVHDSARQFPRGSGSYDMLETKLDQIVGVEGLYVELAGILSPLNTDVMSSFRWAYEKGADAVSFIIPKLRYGHSMAVKDGSLELITRSYEELAGYLIERTAERDFGPLASLVAANDYFGRFIKRVFGREHLTHRCRAGKDMLAIGADGQIYPCLGFVGMSEWAMGTISALPDAAMQDLFCAQHVDVKQSCRECWGRYLCGGGCYAHAAMSNGRIDQPDPQDCALTRHLMQLAVIVVGRLQREHGEVLPQLFSELVKAVPPKHRKFVPPLLRQYLPGAEAGDAAGCAAE